MNIYNLADGQDDDNREHDNGLMFYILRGLLRVVIFDFVRSDWCASNQVTMLELVVPEAERNIPCLSSPSHVAYTYDMIVLFRSKEPETGFVQLLTRYGNLRTPLIMIEARSGGKHLLKNALRSAHVLVDQGQ